MPHHRQCLSLNNEGGEKMIQTVVLAVGLAVAAVTGGVVPNADPGNCTQSGEAATRVAACTEAIVSGGLLGEDVTAAYRLRGLAYRDARNYREAIADYDRALQLQPGNAALLFERAGIYSSLQDYTRAIEDYDQSLQINPVNSKAHFLRGISYYQLGKHPRAIVDYGEALRLDPEFSPVYNERAWTLYLLGRYVEALEDTEQALSRRPHMAPAFDTRAHVLAALGRPVEALAEFERAIDAGGRVFVRMYQKALARHGLYTGEVDGVYGAEVRAGLVACLEEQCRLLK
jgi:tetratricopeptide (TPR) repeat protein